MNILITSNVHWWNAEAAYAARLAELLQRAGHQVWVLTRPGTSNEAHLIQRGLHTVTHISLNSFNPIRLLMAWIKLRLFIQQQQVEVVNAHRSEGYFILVLLRWWLGSFRLVRTRGANRPVRENWLNRMLYCKWTDALIAPGRLIAHHLADVLNLKKDTIPTIYYPTDFPHLPHDVRTPLLKEFSIPEEALVLASVGRVSQIKGHKLLLQSFKKLLEHNSELYLLIFHKHPDPEKPEHIELKRQIQQLGLESRVRMSGPRDNIRAVMKAVDLGVVSSLDSEVICRVAVEFFSVGTPVVSTPVGCLPEVINHGKTGWISKGFSVDSFSQAMQEAIDALKQENDLRKKVLQTAQERYAEELFLMKTLAVFRQVWKH